MTVEECGCAVGVGHSCPIPFGYDLPVEPATTGVVGVWSEVAHRTVPVGVVSTSRDLTTGLGGDAMVSGQSTNPLPLGDR